MSDASADSPPSTSVAIIGGGLAGLATAVALAERGLRVEVFEAKRRLGGRAGSYVDRETGGAIDHCQHVSMGCCTNLADFCRRTETLQHFKRHETLHFFGPDGQRSDFRGSSWLPAPLHLAPALMNLRYLSLSEKLGIARALLSLARTPVADSADALTIGAWLRTRRASPRAIELFWQVVLVSALGESLERASLAAARKVFVDGFLSNPIAYHLLVPKISLSELYDHHVAAWLRSHGVQLHLGAAVETIRGTGQTACAIVLADGTTRPFDFIVLATPWRQAAALLSDKLRQQLPAVQAAERFDAAPISGVHLWFDRAFTDLPHAVLVGRLSQWVFARQSLEPGYYQVVISAAHDLVDRPRAAIIEEVRRDLASIWPAAREAQLLRWQIVTEHEAVFSVRPGLNLIRPPQTTAIANLFLAGDWTATGWPATMEGAVRSGYLAAEGVLTQLGRPERLVQADLPRGRLSRMLSGE